ncbi:MAG: S8 family serine peptidase [Candidatus Heimdallarchaeota archaeon]|nr:S8 family serine peptidase [Candidatus Heimdallarchaeota archaeon]
MNKKLITIPALVFLLFLLVVGNISTVKGVEWPEIEEPDPQVISWGLDVINAEKVWGGNEDATMICANPIATGARINVAIVDNDFDYMHNDLIDRFANDPNFEESLANHAHGTECAGVLAASDNGKGIVGVAPEVNLYSIHGRPDYSLTDALQQIIEMNTDDDSTNDISVISMSLTLGPSDDLINKIAILYEQGVSIVLPSGNAIDITAETYGHGVRWGFISDKVIIVGAIAEPDDPNDPADYELATWPTYWGTGGSNYDVDPGDPSVCLVAPGDTVLTTYIRTSGSQTDSTYIYVSGTSIATPMVAGVVALMQEVNPVLRKDCDAVKQILEETAFTLTADEDAIAKFGAGLVQADAAVSLAQEYLDYDRDGDTLKDITEYIHGLDWHDNSDGLADQDVDGLITRDEIMIHNTFWYDYDSDDDGWSDGDECAIYGTNGRSSEDTPMLDHDGDGIITKTEVDGFYMDEFGWIYTEPYNSDTDGDSWSDGYEIAPLGYFETPSDPTDPFSVPRPFTRW